MQKIIIEYTAVARCNAHNYEHTETSTLKTDAEDIEWALSEFTANWNKDDYGFFKNLKFCPECEAISSTTCTINSIEIIPIETEEPGVKDFAPPAFTSINSAQNKSICNALGVKFQGIYSAYAVHCALVAKGIVEIQRFRKKVAGGFVSAVLVLFNNDEAAARMALENKTKEAKKKIRVTPYADYLLTKSVPTSAKNAQNKSLCETLGVRYDKINVAKAVVNILHEHGLEPRKFRTDNKLSFSDAIIALYNGDTAKAKDALQRHIADARQR